MIRVALYQIARPDSQCVLSSDRDQQEATEFLSDSLIRDTRLPSIEAMTTVAGDLPVDQAARNARAVLSTLYGEKANPNFY
jgi:hypothetical protein